MKKIELFLTKIDADPAGFSKRLTELRVFNRGDPTCPMTLGEYDHLAVSFRGLRKADSLSLMDLATLALLIRRSAEEERMVTIDLPSLRNDKVSEIESYLERSGFLNLFRGNLEQNWMQRVRILSPKRDPRSYVRADSAIHFIPFAWFSRHEFLYDPKVNPWLVRPQVSFSTEGQIRRILSLAGIASSELVDLLAKTMFLELGWNAVLHSNEKVGAGYGIFAAECVESQDRGERAAVVRFCTADLGRGIPIALRKVYREDPDERGEKKLSSRQSVRENTDIVYYALHPTTSSREAYPSLKDRESNRGLADVANALVDIGTMLIRSDGGAVELDSQNGVALPLPSETYHECPLPGTQITARLVKKVRMSKPSVAAKTEERPLPSTINVTTVCDLKGTASNLATAESAANLWRDIRAQVEQTHIFDLGYAHPHAKGIEYLATDETKPSRGNWLVYWNVQASWNELQIVSQWLHFEAIAGGLPPLFVRGIGDARFLGVNSIFKPNPRPQESPSFAWLRRLFLAAETIEISSEHLQRKVALSVAEYSALNAMVNTAYISQGFRWARWDSTKQEEAEAGGFFSGRIHLLRGGKPASDYFSLYQNINCGQPANRRRWRMSCACAIQQLIEEKGPARENLVFVGFTGTMREVLTDALNELRLNCRAYLLLTYDVPSREEIGMHIRRGDDVILVTDVVSTGTLTGAVTELLQRIGANVLGLVSLIDARTLGNDVGTFWSDRLRDLTPYSTARAISAAREQGEIGEREYWVDPVSLVPSRTRIFGWAKTIDLKIKTTLDLIIEAQAGYCGHVVDGARHTSVFVNLRKLIKHHKVAVDRQVNGVLNLRLAERKWENFKPCSVFFPLGISRFEILRRTAQLENTAMFADGADDYDASVQEYITILEAIYGRLRQVPVPRAFGPGGGAQCATTLGLTDSFKLMTGDVIVADDGLWTGTTAASLVTLAQQFGATRILVAPLLARVSPSDAIQLEAHHSLGVDKGGSVQVCYAFPFLLPIPYYLSHECPYETTIERLRHRAANHPAFAEVANDLISRLGSQSPVDATQKSQEYFSYWCRLRSYVELASISDEAFDKAVELIGAAASDDALEAVFTLFTEEWRLIGRARLRQSLAQVLREKAVEFAIKANTSGNVRIAAATLLRSLFRSTYAFYLQQIVALVGSTPSGYARTAFQIVTLLENPEHFEKCRAALQALVDYGLPMLQAHSEWSEEERTRVFNIIVNAQAVLLQHEEVEPEPLSPIGAAMKLWEQLVMNVPLKHETRGFVRSFVRQETLSEFKGETFGINARAWQKHRAALSKMIPLIVVCEPLLRRGSTADGTFQKPDLLFLNRECDTLRHAIAGMSSGLEYLSCNGATPLYTGAISGAASILSRDILNYESTTVRLLRCLRRVSVNKWIDQFCHDCRLRFAGLKPPLCIDDTSISSTVRSLDLLIPADLASSCIAHIIDNLEEHAFTAALPQTIPAVRLTADLGYRADGTSQVTVLVANNGAPLSPDRPVGGNAKRLATALNMFGTELVSPINATEPWRTNQGVSFVAWPNTYENKDTRF